MYECLIAYKYIIYQLPNIYMGTSRNTMAKTQSMNLDLLEIHTLFNYSNFSKSLESCEYSVSNSLCKKILISKVIIKALEKDNNRR